MSYDHSQDTSTAWWEYLGYLIYVPIIWLIACAFYEWQPASFISWPERMTTVRMETASVAELQAIEAGGTRLPTAWRDTIFGACRPPFLARALFSDSPGVRAVFTTNGTKVGWAEYSCADGHIVGDGTY